MRIIEYTNQYFEEVANLLALFRMTLLGFKDIKTSPDIESAKSELKGYVDDKWPLYVALEDNKAVGYILLRVDGVVWIEHIFVKEGYRRKGIASGLFAKAEECSNNLNEDTVFNYVHPNNEAMINFLKSKGYSVINMIEIRKPYKNEKPKTKIKVGNNEFDY